MKTSGISKETLLKNGWIEQDDPLIPFIKKIENRNPINDDDEETGLNFVVHLHTNYPVFALLLPDGGFINFNISDYNDIENIERLVDYYDPPI